MVAERCRLRAHLQLLGHSPSILLYTTDLPQDHEYAAPRPLPAPSVCADPGHHPHAPFVFHLLSPVHHLSVLPSAPSYAFPGHCRVASAPAPFASKTPSQFGLCLQIRYKPIVRAGRGLRWV